MDAINQFRFSPGEDTGIEAAQQPCHWVTTVHSSEEHYSKVWYLSYSDLITNTIWVLAQDVVPALAATAARHCQMIVARNNSGRVGRKRALQRIPYGGECQGNSASRKSRPLGSTGLEKLIVWTNQTIGSVLFFVSPLNAEAIKR